MLRRQEDIQAINFEGLLIYDFTAGQATTASFATIEMPAGIRHREAWPRRSEKYSYLISGRLSLTLDGVEYLLSEGSFCRVAQGQKFSYHNNSRESVQLLLVHVPSCELSIGDIHRGGLRRFLDFIRAMKDAHRAIDEEDPFMAAAPSTSWIIRDCRPEEVAAVLSLWRQAEATPDVSETVEDLTRAIVDSPAIVLVAEAEGRLIGSIIGSFDGWRGNIYRLAVHPDFRRHGIARALVAEIEQRLAKQGAKRMIAPVEGDHPWAMGFWQAVHYTVLPNLVRFVRDL